MNFKNSIAFVFLLLLDLAGYGVIMGSNLQHHIQFNVV